jgi:hypothetical protein
MATSSSQPLARIASSTSGAAAGLGLRDDPAAQVVGDGLAGGGGAAWRNSSHDAVSLPRRAGTPAARAVEIAASKRVAVGVEARSSPAAADALLHRVRAHQAARRLAKKLMTL